MHLLCIFWLWFHCELISLSILQNCKDLLKVETGLCTETYVTSRDGNEVISVQVEATDEQQEVEDPLLISFPVIKPEHEVRCTYVTSPVVGRRLMICSKINLAISLKTFCNKTVSWPCYGLCSVR
jgi:hypothetical protein